MSFGQAVSSVLRQYATFTGRARRSEFWFFYLFFVLVYGSPYLLGTVAAVADTDPVTGEPDGGPLTFVSVGLFGLALLIALGLFLPNLAVTVRRLHDTGRSGFWYFIGLVPFVGPIILLVFLVQPSQPHPNEHGPDPAGPALGYGQGYAPSYGQGYGQGYAPPSLPQPYGQGYASPTTPQPYDQPPRS